MSGFVEEEVDILFVITTLISLIIGLYVVGYVIGYITPICNCTCAI